MTTLPLDYYYYMDKTARTHTNLSNRAGAREAVQRRVVFKGVLDNPFGVKWCACTDC